MRRQLCLRRQGGDKRLRLGDERLKRGDALGEALALVPVVSFFLFFTALFSQFVRLESDLWEKLTLALIAGGVDIIWYLLVALTLSHFQSVVRFQRISGLIDKIFAIVLIGIASTFIFQITQG